MGAFLGYLCISALADAPKTSPTVTKPGVVTPPPVGTSPTTTSKLPSNLTSLFISYPDAARGDSVKLLEAKVSFEVKDASFLTILGSLLASANTHCSVECRTLKPMKLTMNFHDAQAGPLLDAFAKAGGARLWVFPDKLLLAPESLLTPDEKKTAKLYGVLLSKDNLPKDSSLGKTVMVNRKNILDVANTKVSVDFNNSVWTGSMDELRAKNGSYGLSGYAHHTDPNEKASVASISASFSDVTIGDALAFIAHANGCELYVKSDEFVICAPSDLSDENKKQAVLAFTSPSTHFDFGPKSNLDPSAKGS